MKKASVIVLAWNGMDYLGDCLDAVLAQEYADFEVIVVDNQSADGSADFVAAHYPQVRLIRNDRNLGFSGGNNVGLQAAEGDIFVLLNQDTKVQPGWLSALATTLEDPTIGIAGCKLLYPDGTIQHAGGRIVNARGAAEHIGRHEPDRGQYDQLRDVDYVTGAAMALTRATWQRIGPLDEGFFPAYYEDTDWCYRARGAGLRVVYCPAAVAIHYESTSAAPDSYEHQANFNHGRLRFLLKHWPLDDLHTSFLPAESVGIQNLSPGMELEALRQAWVRILNSLPDIVQFRLSEVDSATESHELWQELFHIVMTLRGLCAKEQPLYSVHEALDDAESHAVGTQLLRQPPADAEDESPLAALHQLWQIKPQPLQSEVPVLGPGIAAFREAWLSIATRQYVQSLLSQQRKFNAAAVQFLVQFSEEVKTHDHGIAATQVELLHLLRQMADDVRRTQQESAQHVRELNFLLAKLLDLQMRVMELEEKLKLNE